MLAEEGQGTQHWGAQNLASKRIGQMKAGREVYTVNRLRELVFGEHCMNGHGNDGLLSCTITP